MCPSSVHNYCLMFCTFLPPSPSLLPPPPSSFTPACIQLPSTFHCQWGSLVSPLCWPLLAQGWGASAVWWGAVFVWCVCVCVCTCVRVCSCGVCACVYIHVCVYVHVLCALCPTDNPFLQYKCWHPERKTTPNVNAPWQKKSSPYA